LLDRTECSSLANADVVVMIGVSLSEGAVDKYIVIHNCITITCIRPEPTDSGLWQKWELSRSYKKAVGFNCNSPAPGQVAVVCLRLFVAAKLGVRGNGGIDNMAR
jgi:hypothetical protein